MLVSVPVPVQSRSGGATKDAPSRLMAAFDAEFKLREEANDYLACAVIHERTIVTPAARELGDAHRVLVGTSGPAAPRAS